MAELSYNDAYRAARDAANELRGIVNRISAQTERIDDIQLLVSNLQQTVANINRQMVMISNAVSRMTQQPQQGVGGDVSLRVQQISQSTQRLDIRMQQIEEYLRDVSIYLNTLREREEEEEAFKSNSAA